MSVPEETVRPAAFLLDLYGTLVDIHTDENQPSLWKRMAGFVLSRGADWEEKALHRAYLEAVHREEERLRLRDRGLPHAHGEIDLALVFARLYGEKGVRADAALIAETALAFRKAATCHIRLYAGAKELLAVLRQRGRVILLSNAQSLFTRPELEMLGLTDCFDSTDLRRSGRPDRGHPRLCDPLRHLAARDHRGLRPDGHGPEKAQPKAEQVNREK